MENFAKNEKKNQYSILMNFENLISYSSVNLWCKSSKKRI